MLIVYVHNMLGYEGENKLFIPIHFSQVLEFFFSFFFFLFSISGTLHLEIFVYHVYVRKMMIKNK